MINFALHCNKGIINTCAQSDTKNFCEYNYDDKLFTVSCDFLECEDFDVLIQDLFTSIAEAIEFEGIEAMWVERGGDGFNVRQGSPTRG